MLTSKDNDIGILQEKFITLVNQRKSFEIIGDEIDVLYFIDFTLNSDRQNYRDIFSKFDFFYFRNNRNLEDLEEEIINLAGNNHKSLENKYMVCIKLDQIKIRFVMGFALQYNFRLIVIDEKDSKIFPDKIYLTYSPLFLNDIYKRLSLIFDMPYRVTRLNKISDIYQNVLENKVDTLNTLISDNFVSTKNPNEIHENKEYKPKKETKQKEPKLDNNLTSKTTLTLEDIESMSDKLTLKEINVLRYLVKRGMITRELLTKIVWQKSINEVTADAIDQFVSRLRRKITNLGYSKDILKSRKGYGFELLINV